MIRDMKDMEMNNMEKACRGVKGLEISLFYDIRRTVMKAMERSG
jgi:hypothetical protein